MYGHSLSLFKILEGLYLSLLDEKGKERAALTVGENGPKLSLFDEKGEGRAVLGTGQTIAPDGKRTIYPESSLRLFGSDEMLIWQAP